MQEIARQIRNGCRVRRHERVTRHKCIALEVLKLLRESVHLVLQFHGIIHFANARVPRILRLAVGCRKLLPIVRILRRQRFHELARVVAHLQLGMRGGEQYEVFNDLNAFGSLRSLVFDRPVSSQKRDDIDSDERERDNWPAAPLHIFVPEG